MSHPVGNQAVGRDAHTTKSDVGASPAVVENPSENHRNLHVDELLMRMREGNRDAAAEFITRYEARIRRRIRGKLNHAMRRLFDSQEILSSLGRRLDVYVKTGRLKAASEEQLWSLVFKIADNALIDKARVYQRLQSIEGSDAPFARDLLHRLEHAESTRMSGAKIEIDHAIRALPDQTDRVILSRWLVGQPHSETARELDMNATGVRKRWQSIKAFLRHHFESRDNA